MGDRLAFNNGIIFLSIVATLVFVAFKGNTSSLIPLYAVGVFLAFTLSQAGMVVHWWRLRGAGWRTSIIFSAVGCAMSAIVFLVAAITKFTAGAWVSLLIVLAFTAVALLTRHHFDRVADAIALSTSPARDGESEEAPADVSNLVVVPVPQFDRVTVRALAYAVSLGQPVLALHVSPSEVESERFRRYWAAWGNTCRSSSSSRHIELSYHQQSHTSKRCTRSDPSSTLTVIVPDLAVRHLWQRLLHDNEAFRLRRALAALPKVIVTSVPFHV